MNALQISLGQLAAGELARRHQRLELGNRLLEVRARHRKAIPRDSPFGFYRHALWEDER